MLDTLTSKMGDPGQARRVYYRIVYAVLAVAIVGLLAGLVTGRELLGTVIYCGGTWIGSSIAFLAPNLTDVPLQDSFYCGVSPTESSSDGNHNGE